MNVTMKNSSAVIEQLLQSTHEEALARNEAQEEKWRAYSAENEDLCSRLLSLRDKLKHDVMVPVGRKALFRGQLVHTNEIMVCLGDGWFVKKSAAEAVDVCRRKMKECDEMLERLRKERELLESRKTFPIQNDVFGGRDEIIEPFNEEEESKWREKHKESLKRYRRDLKAERERRKEDEARSRDSNKHLFKILDGLECQEQNDDELNRLVEDEDQARFVEKHVKQELNRRKANQLEYNREDNNARSHTISLGNRENNIEISHSESLSNGENSIETSHTESQSSSKGSEQTIDNNVLRSIENLNINDRSSSNSERLSDGSEDIYDDDDDDDDDEEEEEEEEDDDDDDEEEEDDDDDDDEDDDGIEFRDDADPNSSYREKMQTLLKLYNDQIGEDHDVIDDNSQPRKKKKSVQFQSDSDKLNVVHLFHNDNRTGNDLEDDGCLPAVIHFKHSDVEGDSCEVAADSDEPIRSPSDVYRCFGNCGKVVKSILKAPERGVTLDPSLECRREVAAKPVSTSTIQAVSDVVEHETVASSREEPSRPVSRFKAARLAARK